MPSDGSHDASGQQGFLIVRGCERLRHLTDSACSPHRLNVLTQIRIEANYSKRIGRAVELLEANDLSRAEEICVPHLSDGNSHANGLQGWWPGPRASPSTRPTGRRLQREAVHARLRA